VSESRNLYDMDMGDVGEDGAEDVVVVSRLGAPIRCCPPTYEGRPLTARAAPVYRTPPQ